MSIKSWLKKTLPPWLRAIRRNCGGINRDCRLFAGNLLQVNLPDDLYLKILNALIFGNGVRKSTQPGRNAPILEHLFSQEELSFSRSIKVLDIGGSAGVDALGNLAVINRYAQVESYVIGDLYTAVDYDPENGIIYDQDGRVVQVQLRNGFVNLNFEFKYRVEPYYHLLNRLRTHLLRRRYRNCAPSPDNKVSIPLVYPPVAMNPVFRIRRVNVFDPTDETFDLIICMNLLQHRYFSQPDIDRGIRNLLGALQPGGFLLTGVTDDYRLLQEGGEEN